MLFELFPVLEQMLNRRGGDLSGGQQQQIAIARALEPGPSVLMLDEPTEGIQPNIIKEIGRTLAGLAAQGLDGRPMAIGQQARRFPCCRSFPGAERPPPEGHASRGDGGDARRRCRRA